MSKDEQNKKQDETHGGSSVVASARAYVKRRFNEELAPIYLFHNFTYSIEVAEKAVEIGRGEGLNPEEIERLEIAGLFYPLGYIGGDKEIWARSGTEMHEWANQENYNLNGADEWILLAQKATKDSSLPVRALHDAAWSWLGRKRYDRRYDLLLMEREARVGVEGDPVTFGFEMQETLLHFQYLSIYGREEFDVARRKNATEQRSNNYKVTQEEMKARTGKNFGRGIDTMYRVSFSNHITLSKLADGKANMMISINTIILSIVITVSGASLSFFEETFFENPEFLIPIISLLLSSLIAVVFAVFSARPSVTEYRVKKDKLIKNKEASLLYFGNFLKLEKSEFVDHMATMKMDQSALYDDLAKDLYDLGAVMHRKYLLLTISYNTFVGGLALAVLSFLAVYLLNIL
jgi:hypothetical protein